jgi:predicted enzyme related to lactoylglutathione lyase
MKVLSITVPIFVSDIEASVPEYEVLLGERSQFRFDIPAKGLSLAKVGGLLVIGGPEAALKPLREIRASLRVDSLDEYFAYLARTGAQILQPPTPTPTGRNMIVKGTDGNVLEYVELREAV